MSIYTINSLNISLLENRHSPFYTPAGILNTPFLLQQLLAEEESSRQYVHFNPASYYFLTVSTNDPLAFDFMDAVWKKTCATLYALNYLMNTTLPELDTLGVSYYKNIQWFLSQHPATTTLPEDLFLLGLHTYLNQGYKHSDAFDQYLPKVDFSSISSTDAMEFGLKHHLNYSELIEHALRGNATDVARFLTYAYFARTFEQQVKKKYSVAKAIDDVWPLMDRQDVSLKETMRALRKHVRGRSFFIDVLDWVQSVPDNADALKKKAIAEIRLSLQDEMNKALAKKQWGVTEYGWAKLLIDLPEDDPLFDKTRIRIGQSLLAARSVSTLNIQKADVFYIAAKAGNETFRYVVEQLKNNNELELHIEYLVHYTKLDLRQKVFCHPVFQSVVDMPQLFNRQMDNVQESATKLFTFWQEHILKRPEDPEKTTYKYGGYQYFSGIHDAIGTIARLHYDMQIPTPLKDTLSREMYSQLWGFLCLNMALVLYPQSPFMDPNESNDVCNNMFIQPNRSTLDLPLFLNTILIFEPEFISSHAHDVQCILQARHTKDVQHIYLRWIDELIGPMYRKIEILDTFIRTPKDLVEFFGALYAQQHPELGVVQKELEIGDLF